MSTFLLIALLLAGIALLWSVLLTVQVHEHRRYARVCLRSNPRRWHTPPQVLVCVPCKGLDLDLAGNLRCVLAQDYPNYRVRFVVENVDDPALDVVRRLVAEATVPCEVLVAEGCTDSGQKVHNLCRATSKLPDEVQVLAFFDSDAKPTPDTLSRMVDRLFRGGLRVVTGYRWFVPKRPTLANLTLASVNAAAASLLNHQGWNLIWGGSWAVTRQLFEKTGLAAAWRGTLSDDLVASRVMREAGAAVLFEPGCMVASPIDVNWKEAASFLRRQFLIARCYAPRWWWATLPLMVIYPLVLIAGLVLATYLAWHGVSLWFAPLCVSAALYGLAVLRARWRQATWSPRVSASSAALQSAARFDRWAAPWSCLFATGVILASAVGRSITWRGIRYHIGPAGRITLLGRTLSAEQRRRLITEQVELVRRDNAGRIASTSIDDAATNQNVVTLSGECESTSRRANQRAA